MIVTRLPFPVGSRVKVVIDKENRDWGYNPFPDNTECLVIGYESILYEEPNASNCGVAPGVYLNTHWVRLALPNNDQVVIGTFHHFTVIKDVSTGQ